MQLQEIRQSYEAQGPCVTVYLEGRSPGEDAEKQIRLRWATLRENLSRDGAGEDVLGVLDDALVVEDIGEVQADGRVLVATADGVLLNDAWDVPAGVQDAAHYTDEPELGDYLRARARSVALLVAIADQQGAVVRQLVALEDRDPDEESEQVVRASSGEHVHKPRGQALSHNQIQRRADEAVKENAQGVVAHLESVARRWRPNALVLAGEVQGRTAVRDELSSALVDICHEIDEGGVGDEGAEQALAGRLTELASQLGDERVREHTERFEEARAHGRAAEGAEAVARAAEMGAVDTLLLHPDRHAGDEAGLIAACTRGDASVGLLDRQAGTDVAAVLRFEAPAEVSNANT